MKNRHIGFTLIELMVVIAVGAILMAIAAPSFQSLLDPTRMSSISGQLMSDLNLARSESINRNSRVLVCARNAAGDGCAATTDWSVGWLVCYDNETTSTPRNGTADGECDAAPADGSRPNPIVLRSQVSNRLTLAGPAAVIRFNPNGSQGAPNTSVPVSVELGFNPASGVTRTITAASAGNVSKQ
jgi:type IV fimbrial biogenesis protein FimT